MSNWIQDIIVWVIAAAALGLVLWQSMSALRGGKSRIGGCGACKGCGTHVVGDHTPTAQRTVFLPAEFLRKRR